MKRRVIIISMIVATIAVSILWKVASNLLGKNIVN